MLNILFYGNCQVAASKSILNLDTNKYNQTVIMCFSTNISQEEFFKHVSNADIIITQLVNDNYRNMMHLSTSYVMQNRKPNSKVIFFDSCYFDLYYFDVFSYNFNNTFIQKPSAYHYHQLVDYYKRNLSATDFMVNVVNYWDLKTTEQLEEIANKNINELKVRTDKLCNLYKNFPGVSIISVSDFIKNNYKSKLLFYTVNHPSKYLLQFICENILFYLNETTQRMNYSLDPLNVDKSIIYKCVQKVVQFDVNKELPKLNQLDDNFAIIQLYYDTYKGLGVK
jgi:hypothetical protein